MKLRALRIRRLPGIGRGFDVEGLDPGLNVVVGPNASGKTSLIRALSAALYREEVPGAGVDVEAEFEDGEGGLTATRLGTACHWTRAGRETEAPPLPDHRFLRCYLLQIEDLLDGAKTDEEVAERLARELAGGYDLGAVRAAAPFGLKFNHGKPEAGELQDADKELQKARQRHLELQEQEARLGRLREEKDAAEKAEREAASYEQALELLAARHERSGLEVRTGEFPDGMDRLRGDEVVRLGRLRDRRKEIEEELSEARTALEEAEGALRDTGLSDEGLDEGAVNERRRLVRRMQDLQSEVDGLRREQRRADEDLKAAVRELGGEPGEGAGVAFGFGPDVVHETEKRLEGKRKLAASVEALDRELERLPPRDENLGDPRRLVSRIGTARTELQRWLAAVGTERAERRRDRWWASVVLGVLAVAASVVAGLLVHFAFFLFTAAAAIAAAISLRSGGDEGGREAPRSRFRETGLREPDSWEESAVRLRLEELDGQLVEAERLAADISRRAEIERERAARKQDLDEAIAALTQTAREVGFDPLKLDASLDRWIGLVREYDRACGAVRSTRAEQTDRHEELERLRDEVRAFLRSYGEDPELEDPSAEVLGDRLDALGSRLHAREQAQRDVRAAETGIRRAEEALGRLDEEVGGIFEEAGLEERDEPSLRERVERFEGWKVLQEELRRARWKEEELRRKLAERQELLDLVDKDEQEILRRDLQDLREQAGEKEAVAENITRTETLVCEAQKERGLERARAERQAAEDRLRDRRNEASFAEAGRCLLDIVEAEHVETARPAALGRAEEWFRLFTRHQYELKFLPGEGGFAALQTASGELRELSELSSGTRMQLLLAVRIAFALEAERGRVSLPLFLDEALTTADPERFQAVADALMLLADSDGRQIFYLTAQPQDVAYWGLSQDRATCIDIAEIRDRGAAPADPEAFVLPARPEVPHPGECDTAEEYAVRLRVPPVDPWEDAGAIHLFHVLRDHLALLHRLLGKGVERVGHLRSILGSDECGYLLSAGERRLLSGRVSAAEVWVESWRKGRGRPVDRRALEDSGAVTDTFMERVVDLNDRTGGDARALLARLEAREIPGFLSKKRRQLEEYLGDQGFIGDGRALTDLEIELRVQSALPDVGAAASPENVFEEARQLVRALEQAVRGAGGSD